MQAPKNEIKPWDLFEIAYRRRWEIILPLFVAVIAGFSLAFILPKAYKASTTILAQPQQLPNDIVRSTVRDEEDTRLINIAQLILNRDSLERIVNDFDLYSDPEIPELTIDAKIGQLRQNVTIER